MPDKSLIDLGAGHARVAHPLIGGRHAHGLIAHEERFEDGR